METRLEQLSFSHEYSYRTMNELATILQAHGALKDALNYYKKALICMKRRHKNKYLDFSETSKIIINMAIVYFQLGNLPESLKYHQHAIEVLERVLKQLYGASELINENNKVAKEQHNLEYQETMVEKGKVHMSYANIYRMLSQEQRLDNQHRIDAKEQYSMAIE